MEKLGTEASVRSELVNADRLPWETPDLDKFDAADAEGTFSGVGVDTGIYS